MLRTLRALLPLAWFAPVVMAQGSFTTDGQGCPRLTRDSGPVLYGRMPPGTWHLEGASLRFTASGGSWSVDVGGRFLERTIDAAVLPIGDDALIGPLGLSFAFPYPGGAGSTTAIDVNSNGRVYLEAGTNPWTGGYFANQILPDFLAATPSICVLGANMNTSFDGVLFFEEHTVGAEQVAVVTWEEVPEWPSIGSNTFQCQLWSSGDVVLCYGAINGSNANRGALVGVSAGGGLPDPGPSDLTLPLTFALEAGRPVIGDSLTLSLSGVPLSATQAILGLGRPGFPVPAGFTPFGGSPECRLLIAPQSEVSMELTPPTARATLAWPYDVSLVGFTLECQAFVLDPGQGETLQSHRGTLVLGAPADLAFVVEGANSYYGAPTQFGFFRLESSPGATHAGIERLVVEFTGGEHYFDTVGNAGVDGQGFFSDGNGQGPSCRNAYYGSDLATGLVYGGPLQGLGCDDTGTTGWVGEEQLGNFQRFRRLIFEFDDFAAGEVFRFDCDTDGGGFEAGAQPLVVTVTLTDGTVLTQPVQVISHERAEGVLIQ